jgi:hypothetical protein
MVRALGVGRYQQRPQIGETGQDRADVAGGELLEIGSLIALMLETR